MSVLVAMATALMPRSVGGQIIEARQYISSSGTDRLTLRRVAGSLYWRLCLGPELGRRAVDFHSLVWERNARGGWSVHKSMSQRHFWRATSQIVSDLHGFEPDTGIAVIQLMEDQQIAVDDLQPDGRSASQQVIRASRAQYAWVSWDMHASRVVAVLKVCKFPLERFDG